MRQLRINPSLLKQTNKKPGSNLNFIAITLQNNPTSFEPLSNLSTMNLIKLGLYLPTNDQILNNEEDHQEKIRAIILDMLTLRLHYMGNKSASELLNKVKKTLLDKEEKRYLLNLNVIEDDEENKELSRGYFVNALNKTYNQILTDNEPTPNARLQRLLNKPLDNAYENELSFLKKWQALPLAPKIIAISLIVLSLVAIAAAAVASPAVLALIPPLISVIAEIVAGIIAIAATLGMAIHTARIKPKPQLEKNVEVENKKSEKLNEHLAIVTESNYKNSGKAKIAEETITKALGNTWLKSKKSIKNDLLEGQKENKEINNEKKLEFKQPQQPSNTNSNNPINKNSFQIQQNKRNIINQQNTINNNSYLISKTNTRKLQKFLKNIFIPTNDGKLYKLNLYEIPTSPDPKIYFSALATFLQHNPKVTELKITSSKCPIATKEKFIALLSKLIAKNKTLKSISLFDNSIGDKGTKHLAKALSKNNTIKHIGLSCNNIGSEGIQYLAEALKKNNAIKHIDLCHNNIGSEGIQYLADALKKNNTIKHIGLAGNDIGSEGIQYLADALSKNNTIKHIGLAGNDIGSEGIQYLADALKKNNAIKHIDLCRNDIGSEGTKHLADALRENNTISWINLSRNHIGGKGTKHLANALRENNTISRIVLNHNNLGDEGTKHLADALRENKVISWIDLNNNNIGAEGTKHLADALSENNTISWIYLSNNYIGGEGTKHLAEGLKKNKMLRYISLNHSNIGDEGAKHLAAAFKVNNTLEEFYLYDHSIGIEGAMHLANAITQNSSLIVVDLYSRMISKRKAKEYLNKINEKLEINKQRKTNLLKAVTVLCFAIKYSKKIPVPKGFRKHLIKLVVKHIYRPEHLAKGRLIANPSWFNKPKVNRLNNQVQDNLPTIFNNKKTKVVKQNQNSKNLDTVEQGSSNSNQPNRPGQ